MGVDLGVAGRTLHTETVRGWRGKVGWGTRGGVSAGPEGRGRARRMGRLREKKKKSGRCQLIRGGRQARRAAATPRGRPRGCLRLVVALGRVEARARERWGRAGRSRVRPDLPRDLIR